MSSNTLSLLILVASIGHIALSIASLAIPSALKWNDHLRNLQPLLRQMFWTYAGYILVINVSFGIVSLIATEELLNGSILAKSMTLFIAAYWLARIVIQFFYFDRSQAPKGLIYTIGEAGLVALFGFFSFVYAAAFLFNNAWI